MTDCDEYPCSGHVIEDSDDALVYHCVECGKLMSPDATSTICLGCATTRYGNFDTVDSYLEIECRTEIAGLCNGR